VTALSDLLAPKTKTQRLNALLAALKAEGFPVTAWLPGDAARTLLEVDAQTLASLDASVASVAAGGYRSTATGEWLTLLASEFFGLERNPALFAEGPVLLVDAGGTGPHNIAAGDFWVAARSGQRFVVTESGALPQNGVLVLQVRAESPGAVNVGVGAINQILTSLPGVQVSNWFGPVAHEGTGTGTVTPAPIDEPEGTADVVVTIKDPGAVGVATFRYSLDGGETDNGVDLTTAATYDITSVGIRLHFDGTFVAGDTYTFDPTRWLTQVGTPTEPDASLQARCGARWGELGPGANQGFYVSKALAVTPQVTRVAVSAGDGDGTVNVLIASASGELDPGVVADVQAALDEVAPLTDDVVVASVQNKVVSFDATLFGRSEFKITALAQAQAAVEALIAGEPIGGRGDGKFYAAGVIEALMSPEGVENVVTDLVDLAITSNEVVAPGTIILAWANL